MAHPMLKQIHWLGHAGFAIQAEGKTIVIDPFESNLTTPADIILITHAHHDHCSTADIDKIQKDHTIIVTEPQSAGKLSGNIKVVAPGDRVEAAGITVQTVAAYNVNKSFHPKANNWLGFIIAIGDKRIYHSGDSDLIPEMDEVQAHIALMPVSGTYVMTAEEAVQAVKKIRPELAIPMHYDAIVGSKEDARRFKEGLAEICEVAILTS